MTAARRRPPPGRAPGSVLPPVTVVILGNSRVRLIPTARGRLQLSAAQELATAQFCAQPATALPAAIRRLLDRPLAVCSVHTAALDRLRALSRTAGVKLHLFGEHFGPGLPVRLGPAARKTVGRDRLAAAKAAYDEFPQGALVCDIGTALTINRVSARGFEGGLIAPGLQLALNALHRGTSQLPAVEVPHGRRLRFPARTTADALQLGALAAVAGAIEKIYHAEAARHPGLPLILTGGGGIILRRLLTPRGAWRPHLVATGVYAAFCEYFAGRQS